MDRRVRPTRGLGRPGMLSCAHWLSWRIGLSLGTARDQVRVARRLPDLPALADAFADGRVSYSKVRAITRVAEPDDGIDWVELSRHSSAAQLDKLVRGVHRARTSEQADRDPEQAVWQLRTRTRYDEHGNFVLTIRGPAQLLPVITAGLAAKKQQLQQQRDITADRDGNDVALAAHHAAVGTLPAPAPTPTAPQRALRPVPDPAPSTSPAGAASGTEPPAVNDADALLALAQDALQDEHATRPDLARRRRRKAQLTLQIDPLSGWARQADGELLPPSSLRTVLKTLPGRGGPVRLRPVTDTDLDNLVLVCSRHHTVLHAHGFQLVLHPDRRLEVHTADGVPVLHHPAQPWGDPAAIAAGCGRLVSAETLAADHCDGRLDLHDAISVLRAQAS